VPNSYRAFISVPIEANSDDEAEDKAADYARSLLHPATMAIAGHVELLIEVDNSGLAPKRSVYETRHFRGQLPEAP